MIDKRRELAGCFIARASQKQDRSIALFVHLLLSLCGHAVNNGVIEGEKQLIFIGSFENFIFTQVCLPRLWSSVLIDDSESGF